MKEISDKVLEMLSRPQPDGIDVVTDLFIEQLRENPEAILGIRKEVNAALIDGRLSAAGVAQISRRMKAAGLPLLRPDEEPPIQFEIDLRHNVHGFADKVGAAKLSDGRVMLRVSRMEGFYVGASAILEEKELKDYIAALESLL